MAKYDISKQALEDLYKIWEYTVDTWSETQADKYYKLLENAMDEIGTNPQKTGKPYKRGLTPIVSFLAGKDVGQDGAADAVPGAGDGAGYYGHGVGGHEERHCKVGAQTCVLHADLD